MLKPVKVESILRHLSITEKIAIQFHIYLFIYLLSNK